MRYVVAILCIVIIVACSWLWLKMKQKNIAVNTSTIDTIAKIKNPPLSDTINYAAIGDTSNSSYINTGKTNPGELVNYAETLIGVPYVFASSNPSVGFDCSGFITYVFNHFDIKVPRSSIDFTNVPHEVTLDNAKPADLILFTGTDSTIEIVGHMGIIVQHNNGELLFIHSTSGKANGVTITPLNDYYKSRFVKIVRVFPQNDNS